MKFLALVLSALLLAGCGGSGSSAGGTDNGSDGQVSALRDDSGWDQFTWQ